MPDLNPVPKSFDELSQQCRDYTQGIETALSGNEEAFSRFALMAMSLIDRDDLSTLLPHEQPVVAWLAMAKATEIVQKIAHEKLVTSLSQHGVKYDCN